MPIVKQSFRKDGGGSMNPCGSVRGHNGQTKQLSQKQIKETVSP
jgi:hypothetical protein